MKKAVIALAVCGMFSGFAVAQTSVTVYGVLDTALVAEGGNSAGSLTKLNSGVSAGSRIGFKGTEDLGGGLSALFVLENGFQADTGALGQGGLLFGRQGFVGLSGNFGTLTFGRQYTPQFLTVLAVDPFTTGMAGNAPNLMALTGSGSRTDNTIKYASPNFNGFTGEFAYSFGEVAGDNSAGRQLGAAVAYVAGPLLARLGYHERNNDTAALKNLDTGKNTTLAATYDFGPAKAHFAYGTAKGLNSSPLRNTSNPYGSTIAPVPSTDSTEMLIGATIPMGAHTILVSYVRKDDKTALDQDADQIAIGYRYALSKRTDLYSAYAKIKNRNGAGYTVGSAIEAGSGDKAFNLGIRHTF